MVKLITLIHTKLIKFNHTKIGSYILGGDILLLETWINLSIKILNEKTEEYLKSRTVGSPPTPQWLSMSKAHPRGVTAEGDPASRTMTLEATFRHIYFEETTHLFNIQRLKKAQNLDTKVAIPKVGYWMLDGWDRSDP